MQTSSNFYVSLIYLLAAVPYAWLGLFAWRKRPAVAVTPFAWTMLGLSVWTFTYSLKLFLPDFSTTLFLTKVEYLGIVSFPVFLLFFSLEYTGKSHLLTLRARLSIWAFPILVLILVWTNEFHHLIWGMESMTETNGLKLLNVDYNLFFWLHIIYSYTLAIFAGILLSMEMLQRPGVYRIQTSFVILGILAALAGSLINADRFNPIPNLNITPLLFLPVSLGLAWAIVRYRLLEILPLEHLAVLKDMKDGIIVVSPNKRVLYINSVIEDLVGKTDANVIGQPLNHISKEYGEILASQLTETEHKVELTIGSGNQSRVFEVGVSLAASKGASQNASKPNSIMILHDITERKKAEADLSRRETMMSAISLAAEQFLKESTWERNIPGVLEKIGQAANVSRIYVFMNYSDENDIIYSSQCYEWAAPGVTAQINNPDLQHVNLLEAGFARWQEKLSGGNSIYGILRDFPESEKSVLQSQNILSMALIPIFVENHWWGFIGFDECNYERQWTETELEALHITASIFGSAETRARTEQRLIRRQQALSLLQDIVSESLRAKTRRQMTEGIVDQLAKLIYANECFITLWDENNTQNFPIATYGTSGDTYLSMQPVLGEYTLTELALRRGHTLVVDDAHNSALLDHEIAQQCPSRSVIVLPLIAASKKLGALILSFREYHHFQAEEVSICEQAANLIALAFEKFRAVELAQQRADTSETLRKAGAAITETLETNKTVARILDQLKQVVPYDTASVQLLDDNELEIIGGSGFADLDAVIGVRFPVPANNPNTVVIQTGKPYLLPEVSDVYSEFRKEPHNHIHSWLGVPLIFQERVIGLLAIDSVTPNHFNHENVSLAATFADQVAVALENARIYERVQNQAITDPLTGVYNRRGLLKMAKEDFTKSLLSGRPFSGIMIDLDYFKHINDTYGHSVGDQILREFARRCKSCIRELDYVGRYGGEEFVVILPETSINTAIAVAERLRTVISSKPMIAGDGLEINITASLGLAQRDKHTHNLETLIQRADQAMYVSKHKGRNCVSISE
jgi:diguanylate cyclase (GGDEF)-like protein/PAS domain S-box-containing protein